jgi:carboxylesterase type B
VTPGVLLGEQLHCQYQDLACFRNATYQEIVAAQVIVNNMFTSFDFLLLFEPWTPVIDGLVVQGQLIDMVQNVSFSLKPLMIGTVTEDGLLFVYEGFSKPVSPVEYFESALASFHLDAVKVIEHFPPEGSGDQRPLLSKIATRWVFACTNRIIARRASAYMYAFNYPLDFDGWENATYCNGHTCHGVELPYLFESFWVNFTDTGRQLSTTVATYWTNFGKTMNPNQPIKQAVSWPKMTDSSEPFIYLQNPVQVQMDYLKDDCDFLDRLRLTSKSG